MEQLSWPIAWANWQFSDAREKIPNPNAHLCASWDVCEKIISTLPSIVFIKVNSDVVCNTRPNKSIGFIETRSQLLKQRKAFTQTFHSNLQNNLKIMLIF